MRAMPLEVRQVRGGLVETTHAVSAVVHDGERATWSVGPDLASFWRSACKALQLTTSLECLDADLADALPEEDLAVGASSHSGQPMHIARVEALLARFGLDASGLRCGAHWPMHEPSARALPSISAVHNNCSGKHTFMLAAAISQSWDPDYLPPEHPLQARNRARIEEWSGCRAGVAVDGCGVPTFHHPLSAQARAIARLAHEMRAGSLAGRVGWAMARHPDLVSGTGRLDLLVVRQSREPMAVKVGAEGLFTIAMPESGIGIAVKVHTGNNDALAVAVRAVLDEVAPGVMQGDWPWHVVKNVARRAVGQRLAAWT
jgi:L-asparaginase II